MRRFPPLALTVALALSAGCRRGGEAGAPVGTFPKAPVVLISIDTLRSDHLPAYGYRQVETPAIDALRAPAPPPAAGRKEGKGGEQEEAAPLGQVSPSVRSAFLPPGRGRVGAGGRTGYPTAPRPGGGTKIPCHSAV